MSDNKNGMMQQEEKNISLEPEAIDMDMENMGNEDDNTGQEEILADDFKLGDLLLGADEDRAAFKLFFNIAKDDKENEKKRKVAIDKLLYIALRNSHNPDLLENETWEAIENLSRKKKEGYEYAYLLLHFRYYAKGGWEENEVAYQYLEKYFKKLKNNKEAISPIAYLQMGICIEWGVGMKAEKISENTALEYFEKARKKGCVAAYRYIVSLYLFGGDEIKKDLNTAKNVLKKGVTILQRKFIKGEKEVMPFFEGLVGYCFKGDWEEMEGKIQKKGKEWAQYMINNGIKGGNSLMGLYFLNSKVESNNTIANDYYEKAIKNNDNSAYWGKAVINYIDNNYEEAYKFAFKGIESPKDSTLQMLGLLYENLGEQYEDNNKKEAEKCFVKAWEFYEKSYYRFGTTSENLGKIYLEKKVKPRRCDLKTLEDILEHSARIYPEGESIQYYLRFIQKINGKEYSKIDKKYVYNEVFGTKYRKYLKLGADQPEGNFDLLAEYVKLLMKEWKEKDDGERVNDMKYIVRAAEKILFDGEFVKFVGEHTDDNTKLELSKKLVEKYIPNFEDVDFIYKNAEKRTRAKLSKKLVGDFYQPYNKKQFIDILDNYNGKQDDSFTTWFIKSLTLLFLQENKAKMQELIRRSLEASSDEKLNEYIRSLREQFQKAGNVVDMVYMIINNHMIFDEFISIVKESNDDNLVELFNEYNSELEKYVDSFDDNNNNK